MEKLKYLSEKLNITINDRQLLQFKTYYEMLIEKNKVMNLTAITEKDEVILKHFIDSISVAAAVPEFRKKAAEEATLIDVGTGAGFPGIPLKIIFPNLKITLLDSLGKRVTFLNEVISALGLTGITAIHDRAEDAARKEGLRDSFDYAVSRAVAAMPVLSEYTLPFVKTGGSLISYKTPGAEAEINDAERAIKLLGGGKPKLHTLSLPDSDISRSFVVVPKKSPTPKRFPRKAGTAKREPL
ncbi:MAG: 16S rRNA (guanine(527)-N(7))-methyltransferase RsmG [Eubacterium sp.]|nr:16S rRNA (guanine(527)-N(7))-methyltransferase RsmG [Eubacterium sp.]